MMICVWGAELRPQRRLLQLNTYEQVYHLWRACLLVPAHDTVSVHKTVSRASLIHWSTTLCENVPANACEQTCEFSASFSL